MTTIPTFPSSADITRQIENIAPTRARYQAIWQAFGAALDLAPAPESSLDALAAHAAETGEIPSPETLREAAHAALATDRDAAFIRNALDSVQRRYQTLPAKATTDQAHQILKYLGNEALPAVIKAVKALPAGAPLTAEDALDHEDPTLYRTARTLVAAYDAIRSQQRTFTKLIADSSVTSTSWSTMLAHSGTAKNATEWDPYWLDIRRAQGQRYGAGLEQRAEHGNDDNHALEYFTKIPSTSWPATPERSTWPENTDDEQRARWLIRAARDLDLWVPSWRELTEAHAENAERTSVSAWVAPIRQRSTRIDYFGRKHVTETEVIAGVKSKSRTKITR
ncbi:hypothetical protein M3F59_12745 [Brachybacterium muris]|uniref:hypothetical protein n=1 Tax=Brachybacterium muris TaxID=219301 RepID=UPI00223BFBAD|nr:hypothetical protein [Brachybacterium muris]MCT2262471.1 hypothetical protein [Brachybacterium muris]